MTYDKLQLVTKGILPLIAFFLAAVLTFLLLLSTHVELWIVCIGPLAMGICGVIIIYVLAAPFNNFYLTRELKGGKTGERLAAWFIKNPEQEFYVGPNGAWHNSRKYYWGHSLFLNLEDVCLKRTPSGIELIIKLGETLGRSTRYFNLELPIPSGHESEAETIVLGILAANIILDENQNRTKDVRYI
ncbi:MAG: hypothetical protein D3924_20865 [Candidatus Electrothrix sp. AR4]|nr:hypothetical protein [Candidatus Electrothrix sp. AR4]